MASARRAEKPVGRRKVSVKKESRAKAGRQGGRGKVALASQKHPARKVRVTEMDPVAKCGKDTSVERLFRVEETLNQTRAHHMVFLDHYGWYCEHGRSCPAVQDVKQFNRK